jgi:hypothetical protein
MGLRGRMSRLEKQADGLYRTLRLPRGTEVRYSSEEMLYAVSAAIRREEHRLFPYTRQMDTKEGMPGLIRAIEGSRCLSEADG